MFFLGIDQSARSTGVAVVSEDQKMKWTGTVTPGKLLGAPRLAFIRDRLVSVITTYRGYNGDKDADVAFAALEGYSMGSTGKWFDLGEVGGIVRLVLHDLKVPFAVVAPTSLKKFVTGSGDSDKEAMAIWVKRKWGVSLEQDDMCDAFGLAQVARSVYLGKGETRSELEVVKKLNVTEKKISLTSAYYPGISI